jgi:hypothetical protein
MGVNREKAILFLKEKARPLEWERFKYKFEDGQAENVWRELALFQNQDGGFGQGLEPDFRCKESSAIASSIGLQILSETGANEANPIVKKVIHYLLESWDPDSRRWVKVTKEVEEAPRAPWWNYDPQSKDWGNPSAEIVGFLHEYKGLVPEKVLEKLTRQTTSYIEGLEEYEFHELLSILRFMERAPEDVRNQLDEKVTKIVKACVETDPNKWESYSLQPIQVVKSPQSPYAELYNESILLNLSWIEDQQDPEGCWNPTWAWGQFEDEWEEARQEWRGVLTLDHLRVLHTFYSIE